MVDSAWARRTTSSWDLCAPRNDATLAASPGGERAANSSLSLLASASTATGGRLGAFGRPDRTQVAPAPGQ